MQVLEIVVANDYIDFMELFAVWCSCKALRPYFVGVNVPLDEVRLRLPSLEFCEKVEQAIRVKRRLEHCSIVSPAEGIALLLASKNYTEEALYVLRNTMCRTHRALIEVANAHGGLSFMQDVAHLLGYSDAALETSSSLGNLVCGDSVPFVSDELIVASNYWQWLIDKRYSFLSKGDLRTDRFLTFFGRVIMAQSSVAFTYLRTRLDQDIPSSAEQYRYVQTTYFDLLVHYCYHYQEEFGRICESAAEWDYRPAISLLREVIRVSESLKVHTFTFSNKI